MKYPLIILSLALLSACSLLKKKCTELVVGTENAEMVQANPSNGMYIFSLAHVGMEGGQLHVNSQEGGQEKDVFIINPKNAGAFCEPIDKEKWSWSEEFNDEAMTVEFKASIQLRYEGKTYCVKIAYAGSGMKMMMPAPEPPVPQEGD